MRLSIIVFTFVFGFLSFAPNLQGGQFFKLNELVAHFEAHQESKDSFTSFFSFVKEHYFSNHETKDNEKHLPFKSSVSSTLLLVIHEVELLPIQELTLFFVEQKCCFGEPSGLLKSKTGSIWNPPQMS